VTATAVYVTAVFVMVNLESVFTFYKCLLQDGTLYINVVVTVQTFSSANVHTELII